MKIFDNEYKSRMMYKQLLYLSMKQDIPDFTVSFQILRRVIYLIRSAFDKVSTSSSLIECTVPGSMHSSLRSSRNELYAAGSSSEVNFDDMQSLQMQFLEGNLPANLRHGDSIVRNRNIREANTNQILDESPHHRRRPTSRDRHAKKT